MRSATSVKYRLAMTVYAAIVALLVMFAMMVRAAEPVKDQPTVGELTERSARLAAEMEAMNFRAELLTRELKTMPRQYEDLKAAKDKTDAELAARQPKPDTKSDAKVDIKPK